jgi:hypothetical protein
MVFALVGHPGQGADRRFNAEPPSNVASKAVAGWQRAAPPPTIALQIGGPSRGDLPVVTREAARVVTSTYLCGAAFARSRTRARAMDRPPNLGVGGTGMTGLLGNRLQSNAAPRGPGSRLGAAACTAGNKRNAPPILQVTRTLREPRRYPAGDPSLAEGQRLCRRCARAIRAEPYGPGSTRTASPSSSLLSRADARQAADRGRSRMSLTRLKPQGQRFPSRPVCPAQGPMQLRLVAERPPQDGGIVGHGLPAALPAAVKDPLTAAIGRQALIIRAAAAGVWRRDPTSPALARPPDAGGAGADGVPRDWVRGTRSTHTVRLRAPWSPLGSAL